MGAQTGNSKIAGAMNFWILLGGIICGMMFSSKIPMLAEFGAAHHTITLIFLGVLAIVNTALYFAADKKGSMLIVYFIVLFLSGILFFILANAVLGSPSPEAIPPIEPPQSL